MGSLPRAAPLAAAMPSRCEQTAGASAAKPLRALESGSAPAQARTFPSLTCVVCRDPPRSETALDFHTEQRRRRERESGKGGRTTRQAPLVAIQHRQEGQALPPLRRSRTTACVPVPRPAHGAEPGGAPAGPPHPGRTPGEAELQGLCRKVPPPSSLQRWGQAGPPPDEGPRRPAPACGGFSCPARPPALPPHPTRPPVPSTPQGCPGLPATAVGSE